MKPLSVPPPAIAYEDREPSIYDDLEAETRVLKGQKLPTDLLEQTARARSAAVPLEDPPGLRQLGAAAYDESTEGGALDDATAPRMLPAFSLPTLPAMRVAVMSTGIPGEARIMPLELAAAPPPGAAVAILVPVTAADGDEVTKLFGALE